MIITKTFELKPQHLEDFFCQVVESGYSNYWMGWITFYQNGVDVSYQKLDYSQDFSWAIKDAETDEIYGPIYSNQIANVAIVNSELATLLEAASDEMGIDAEQADNLLQLLTLNEIVFG